MAKPYDQQQTIIYMKKLFTVLFFFGMFTASFGQEAVSYSNTQDFNLPPGSVLKMKPKFTDYSYKLNELKGKAVQKKEPVDFLRDFTKAELKDMELNDKKAYNYYSTANAYFQNLSEKVLSGFSFEELWYIYIFDQKLKNKLASIK
jgi:hypothetical protein